MGLPVESGFMGVDIFFFISGYIVSNVLSEKYFTKSKSLKLFYINRFWRLYPTLIISMILTLLLAITLQSGNEILSTLKNVVFSLFGISNLIYYKESGIYGTSSTDNNPLIHLWSLSVEFQFYLLFPFFYLIINKFTEKTKTFIVLIILVLSLFLYTYSFSIFNLSDKFTNKNMALFYLLPYRAYEFIFGVFMFHLLAFINLKWNLISKISSKVLMISIVYIFIITNISDQNKHIKISLLMLFLCCLMIVSKNRARSDKRWQIALETFGSFAYPIYLVHLPIITLVHIHFPENKYIPIIAGIISLPIGIIISEKIEKKQLVIKSRKFLYISFAILFLLCATLWLSFSNLTYTKDSIESKIFTNDYLFYYNNSGCTDESAIGAINCQWNIKGYDETVFVVGDSQASFGLDAIVPAAMTQNLRVVSGARKGCPFIDDLIFNSNSDKCSETRINDWLWIKDNKPKFVVIANLSTGYLKTSRKTFSNPGGKCPDINGLGCKGYEMSLDRTIKEIKKYGSKVILLQTIPNYTGQFNRKVFDFNPNYTVNKNILSLAREPSYLAEVEVSQDQELYLIDPFLYMCLENQCPLSFKGKYLYANSYHISTEGAKLLIPKLTEIFKSLK
jgi:peptidoglycan/LPS O-acetylase OafA/YrhL